MRHAVIPFAALLIVGNAALAQVTVDLRALDSLPIGSSKLARPVPVTPEPRRVQVPTPPLPTPPRPAAPTPATATTAQPQPALPAETPPSVALAPLAPPEPSTVAPAPPPISATAATVAKPEAGGLRVTFTAAQVELNPDSANALKELADSSGSGNFNILSYAAGSPEDPSAARRLSLSRALAVRSALLADGVASSRIFVRALGAQTGEGPPDRVDVSVLAGTAAPGTAK